MKATQDQIETLANAMPEIERIRQHGAALSATEKYSAGKGDLPQRVRWDAFWAIPSAVRAAFTSSIYNGGGNDSHIDTALRRAMIRLGLPEFAE